MLFRPSISLPIFCLTYFFNYSKRIVEVPTIDLAIFAFCPLSFCFRYFEVLLLGAWTFRIVISS